MARNCWREKIAILCRISFGPAKFTGSVPVTVRFASARNFNAYGPDFLCVGMAKAGTGWLGDQLRHHPQFWMPPVQELAYLGRDAPALRSANRKLARMQERGKRKKKPDKDRPDGRDIGFLRDITACTGEERNIEKYVSFFRHKGDLLSGDISPGYSTLETDIINALAARLPDLRVILLIRDPVERLWSHICMWHRNGKFDDTVLSTPSRFREYLNDAEMATRRSFPTTILAHWEEFEPTIRFRYFFFDDIVAGPEDVRSEVLSFLGADPEAAGDGIPASYNRKSQSTKLAMTEPIKAVLVEHFAGELHACAARVGSCATKWAARYGL